MLSVHCRNVFGSTRCCVTCVRTCTTSTSDCSAARTVSRRRCAASLRRCARSSCPSPGCTQTVARPHTVSPPGCKVSQDFSTNWRRLLKRPCRLCPSRNVCRCDTIFLHFRREEETPAVHRASEVEDGPAVHERRRDSSGSGSSQGHLARRSGEPRCPVHVAQATNGRCLRLSS